jgi:NAD/NADP transhydrogenase beta subunit
MASGAGSPLFPGLNILEQCAAGATDMMTIFLVMSGVAGLIVIAASGLFVASFSIAGKSLTIDAGLAILALLLRTVWIGSLPHVLAVYNGIGGGAACVIGALVIIGNGAAGSTCLPALTGAFMGAVAMYGSVAAWTKLDRPDGANLPVLISIYNAMVGFATALEGVAIRNPALMIAGLIIATGRVLMTLPMVNFQSQPLSVEVTGRDVLF